MNHPWKPLSISEVVTEDSSIQTNQYRFCVDYRKVHTVTKKDGYPIPYLNNILDKSKDARYISTIDLSAAYHQIPLNPKSKEITAFRVPGRRLFQYTKMPIGLTKPPATFQRLMDKLIDSTLELHASACLDDIIMVIKTFEKHLQWLNKVFNKFTTADLKINPDDHE